MIEVTNKAATEFKSIIETEGNEPPAIRIFIIGSSTDAQYGLALADDITDDDVIMENNGIKIVMDPDVAAGFTDGSIDFAADSKTFIIQNAESGTCDNCEECDVCDME
jgi:iron-sulfur cluster insertion protein